MRILFKILFKILSWYRLKTKSNFGFAGSGKVAEPKLGEVATFEVLQKNGQYDPYLPEYEYQRFAWGDVMACVSYSLHNISETILKRKYNETWDFSDRFTAKMSGTTSSGNSMYAVIECFKKWFLSFLMWRNEVSSWNDFYKEVPESLKTIALSNSKTFNVQYQWVEPTSTENLKEALKYSPLWVAIYAYGPKVNGVYQRITGYMPNHCVMIYGWDEYGNWKVFDHYLGNEKRLLAPDYIIGYAMKINITKN
jgi:hypothetical protein